MHARRSPRLINQPDTRLDINNRPKPFLVVNQNESTFGLYTERSMNADQSSITTDRLFKVRPLARCPTHATPRHPTITLYKLAPVRRPPLQIFNKNFFNRPADSAKHTSPSPLIIKPFHLYINVNLDLHTLACRTDRTVHLPVSVSSLPSSRCLFI